MSDIFSSVADSIVDAVNAAVNPLGAAAEILYDAAIIEEIKSALAAGVQELEAYRELPDTPEPAYGRSPTGISLAYNAGLAREKVIEALTNLATGLDGFRTVVGDFHTATETAEVDTTADLTTIKKLTECAAQPRISSPATCSAPGGEG